MENLLTHGNHPAVGDNTWAYLLASFCSEQQYRGRPERWHEERCVIRNALNDCSGRFWGVAERFRGRVNLTKVREHSKVQIPKDSRAVRRFLTVSHVLVRVNFAGSVFIAKCKTRRRIGAFMHSTC